jgi:hypothetical protein
MAGGHSQASAVREGRGVDDQDTQATVPGQRCHHALQEMTVLAWTAADVVGLARRVRLADEGDGSQLAR